LLKVIEPIDCFRKRSFSAVSIDSLLRDAERRHSLSVRTCSVWYLLHGPSFLAVKSSCRIVQAGTAGSIESIKSLWSQSRRDFFCLDPSCLSDTWHLHCWRAVQCNSTAEQPSQQHTCMHIIEHIDGQKRSSPAVQIVSQ